MSIVPQAVVHGWREELVRRGPLNDKEVKILKSLQSFWNRME